MRITMFKVPTYISPQKGGLLTMEIMLCMITDNDCDFVCLLDSALVFLLFSFVKCSDSVFWIVINESWFDSAMLLLLWICSAVLLLNRLKISSICQFCCLNYFCLVLHARFNCKPHNLYPHQLFSILLWFLLLYFWDRKSVV